MTIQLQNRYKEIYEQAKSFTGVDITKVHGIRKGTFVRIRATIIVTMTKYLGTRTVELAELLGIDHTTVIYHRDNHTGRYQSDDEYADLYDNVARFLVNSESDKADTDLVKVIGLIRETLTV